MRTINICRRTHFLRWILGICLLYPCLVSRETEEHSHVLFISAFWMSCSIWGLAILNISMNTSSTCQVINLLRPIPHFLSILYSLSMGPWCWLLSVVQGTVWHDTHRCTQTSVSTRPLSPSKDQWGDICIIQHVHLGDWRHLCDHFGRVIRIVRKMMKLQDKYWVPGRKNNWLNERKSERESVLEGERDEGWWARPSCVCVCTRQLQSHKQASLSLSQGKGIFV